MYTLTKLYQPRLLVLQLEQAGHRRRRFLRGDATVVHSKLTSQSSS